MNYAYCQKEIKKKIFIKDLNTSPSSNALKIKQTEVSDGKL